MKAKWINSILNGLLIALLLAVIVFAVIPRVNGEAPEIMGLKLMNVLSGSMQPSIHTGSIIAIRLAEDPVNYEVGDVIVFRSQDDPNMLITHRIIEVQEAGNHPQYVTKGDANDAPDPSPVPAANVVGRYTGISIPFLGYASTFLQSKGVFSALLIIPGTFLIIWQATRLWRTFARLEDEKKAV